MDGFGPPVSGLLMGVAERRSSFPLRWATGPSAPIFFLMTLVLGCLCTDGCLGCSSAFWWSVWQASRATKEAPHGPGLPWLWQGKPTHAGRPTEAAEKLHMGLLCHGCSRKVRAPRQAQRTTRGPPHGLGLPWLLQGKPTHAGRPTEAAEKLHMGLLCHGCSRKACAPRQAQRTTREPPHGSSLPWCHKATTHPGRPTQPPERLHMGMLCDGSARQGHTKEQTRLFERSVFGSPWRSKPCPR